MRILIVEDDRTLAKLLTTILQKQNFLVDTVVDGTLASQKIESSQYDILILDLNLPGKDGLELCKEARANGVTKPILMLTNRSSTIDRVSGLDAGADDYLPKPFSPEELLARLRALLRRPEQTISNTLELGDLELDVVSQTVVKDKKPIRLMPKEFALLEFLMRRSGEVITRDQLLLHVWGIYSNNSSNRLEVYIRYLREKIDEPFGTKMIQTVRGKGYKIAI